MANSKMMVNMKKDLFDVLFLLLFTFNFGYSINHLLAVEGYIIFVRNIHDESNEEDVLDLFSDAGKVTQLKMPLDRRTGYIKV